MWWEVLPSFTIIGIAVAFPHIYTYYSNKFVLGTGFKREFYYNIDYHHLLRDMRVSGENNFYKQNGLDCLSADDYVEPDPKKCECP